MRFRDKPEGLADHENEGEIRITDRRRRFLEDQPEKTESQAPAPNLKPSYVEELEARTKAAEQLAQDVQARFEQLKVKLQRETDETRQRLNRAADERSARSKADFIVSLLPVLDNLERATEAAEAGGKVEHLLAGLKQIVESFRNALTAAGVEIVPAAGELFDPELHEAIETVAVEPGQEGRVIKEYTRGYRLGDRLLRPARVAVGRAGERGFVANE